jgi:hypothetical protein
VKVNEVMVTKSVFILHLIELKMGVSLEHSIVPNYLSLQSAIVTFLFPTCKPSTSYRGATYT